ncbi:hypothetical protein DL96DRAFT_1809988 [Flagelloscypha sp. PMI_526]|nr:hypothetical protein DL96DRAFT_1809988 [Flagelloscypha sp. PMI_526]
MATLRSALQALSTVASKSQDSAVQTALRIIASTAELLARFALLVAPDTENTRQELFGIQEISLLPLFAISPPLVIKLWAALLPAANRIAQSASMNGELWEGIQERLIYALLDFLENKPTAASRKLVSQIFPVLKECYFNEPATSSQAVLSIVYLLLTEACTSSPNNQSSVRKSCAKEIGEAISRTTDSVALENLLALFATLLPPSSEQARRTQFVNQVFPDHLFSVADRLRTQTDAISTSNWEMISAKVVSILSECSPHFPQPFVVPQLSIGSHQIEPIGPIFFDNAHITATVAAEDDAVDSLKTFYNSVVKVAFIQAQSNSCSVHMELSTLPRVGKDVLSVHQSSKSPLALSFTIPVDQTNRLMGILEHRGISRILHVAKQQKLSTSENPVVLSFVAPQPSTQEKVNQVQKLFIADHATSPVTSPLLSEDQLLREAEVSRASSLEEPTKDSSSFSSPAIGRATSNPAGCKRKATAVFGHKDEEMRIRPNMKKSRSSLETILVTPEKTASTRRYGRGPKTRVTPLAPGKWKDDSSINYDELPNVAQPSHNVKPKPLSAMKGGRGKDPNPTSKSCQGVSKEKKTRNSGTKEKKIRFDATSTKNSEYKAASTSAPRNRRKSALAAQVAIKKNAEDEDDNQVNARNEHLVSSPVALEQPSFPAENVLPKKLPVSVPYEELGKGIRLAYEKEGLPDVSVSGGNSLTHLSINDAPGDFDQPAQEPETQPAMDATEQGFHALMDTQEPSIDPLFVSERPELLDDGDNLLTSKSIPPSPINLPLMSSRPSLAPRRDMVSSNPNSLSVPLTDNILPLPKTPLVPDPFAVPSLASHSHLQVTTPLASLSKLCKTPPIPSHCLSLADHGDLLAPHSTSISESHLQASSIDPAYALQVSVFDRSLVPASRPASTNRPFDHLVQPVVPNEYLQISPSSPTAVSYAHEPHSSHVEFQNLKSSPFANPARTVPHVRDTKDTVLQEGMYGRKRIDASSSVYNRRRHIVPMDEVFEALNDLHGILKQRISERLDRPRREVKVGKENLLRDSARHLESALDETLEHHHRMVELKGRYFSNTYRITQELEHLVAANKIVVQQAKIIIRNHDCDTLSKKMHKSIYTRPLPETVTSLLA